MNLNQINESLLHIESSLVESGDEVKWYSDKWAMKMKGSSLGAALDWIDGVGNLPDKEKSEILKNIMHAKQVDLKRKDYSIDDYSWAVPVLKKFRIKEASKNKSCSEGRLNMSLEQETEAVVQELARFNKEGVRDIIHMANKKIIDPRLAKRIIKNAKDLFVDLNILLDLSVDD